MTPRSSEEQLLLGEWACLGILYQAPTHGFAIAARLKPDGDVGRVWSLSRALTYRSLEQLTTRGFVHAVAQEQGIAGGNRTVLAATRTGRAKLRRWLGSPVAHLRDVRSELLLKLIIAELCSVDIDPMLREQRSLIGEMARAMSTATAPTVGSNTRAGTTVAGDRGRDNTTTHDVVALWRLESSQAALRFLDRLLGDEIVRAE